MTRIERQPRDQSFPLSYGQQRLWFLEQFETDVPAYNCSFALRIRGSLDTGTLIRAFGRLAGRHEALRTTLVLEARELRQRIASQDLPDMPTVEIGAQSEEDAARSISDTLRQEALRRFDLLSGPAVRTRLLRFSANDHVLVVNIHHIFTDGWSLGILIEELPLFYEALRSGASPERMLPGLTVQYVDFAAWERRRLTEQRLDRHLRFWTRELRGAPVSLDMSPDRHAPPIPSHAGGTLRFDWPGVLCELKPIAVEASSTSYILLLAAFCLLVHGRSGQTDFLTGAVTTNRRPEFERVMGFFVNTVVIRADLSGRPTFRELLLRTRRKAIAAYTHQELPFDRFWECVSPAGTPSREPLFRVAFVAESAIPRQLRLDGLQLEVIPPERVSTKFDLTMSIGERGDDLYGEIEYATDLFDEKTILEMLQTYRSILLQVAENPGMRVDDLLAAVP